MTTMEQQQQQQQQQLGYNSPTGASGGTHHGHGSIGARSARRLTSGAHSLRNSLRNSTTIIGRAVTNSVAFTTSREMHLEEEEDGHGRGGIREGDNEDGAEDEISSHASMSSDSSGALSNLGGHSFRGLNKHAHSSPSARRRHDKNGLSKSMVQLNKSGNKAIQWSKFTILGVLGCIIIVIIAYTYVILAAENHKDFQTGFENVALEMLNRVSIKVLNIQTTFHSIATGISGYEISSPAYQTWPFLTMPNWQIRAINSYQLTNSLSLGFSPLVVSGNISQWNTYSQQKVDVWMNDEATQYQQQLFQLVSSNTIPTTTTTTTTTTTDQQQQQLYQQVPSTTTNNNSSSSPTVPATDNSIIGFTDYVYHLDDNNNKIPVVETSSSSSSSNNNDVVVPIWQIAPAPIHNATILNFDFMNHSIIGASIQQVLHTKQPAITPAFQNINKLWMGSFPPPTSTSRRRQMVAEEGEVHQSMSLFLTPLFDQTTTAQNRKKTGVVAGAADADADEQKEPTIVGILYAAIPWNTYIEDTIARDDIRALHVVMEWVQPSSQLPPDCKTTTTTSSSSAGGILQDTFTYRVDGKDATFLGFGDLHEEQYDDMVETMDFIIPVVRDSAGGIVPADQQQAQAKHQQQKEAEANNITSMSVSFCNIPSSYGYYRWLVYPSQELQDTNYNPSNVTSWLYAFSVIGVFCIATIILASYDYLVQLRQKAVLDTAMRSNAIITNLFPSNVRERIMKEAEEQAEAEYQQKKLERKQKRRLRSKKRRRNRNKDNANDNNNGDGQNNRISDSTASNAIFGLVPKNQLKDFLSEGEGRNESKDKTNSDDDEDDDDTYNSNSKPIADLFPAATVMFADIVGFTAWSSVREPAQVFQLLETLYHHFDEIAKRRRVFKVETIGDCYVAVTGLPDPRPDHAVVMSRFARDILLKSKSLCQRLEVILGPDTGDLCLRIGLHSGAVTAGVLRGEKSRFQLFGDTVNTAARMESNGAPSKIHLSQDTAKLLQAAGKKWTKKRQDLVEAKGKGKMQTYWLATGRSTNQRLSGTTHHFLSDSTTQGEDPNARRRSRNFSMPLANHRFSQMSMMSLMKSTGKLSEAFNKQDSPVPRKTSVMLPGGDAEKRDSVENFQLQLEGRASMHTSKKSLVTSKKTTRLVRWNAEVLSRLLKQIVARRNAVKELGRAEPGSPTISEGMAKDHGSSNGSTQETKPDDSSQMDTSDDNSEGEFSPEAKGSVLEEVQEIIHLPTFDAEAARNQDDPYNIQLEEVVKNQLLAFVTEVASMYRGNPFHNFEHASHVTMSVVKLLSRIVAPDAVVDLPASTGDTTQLVKSLHDHTYGITSDPLTQFAVVLSALIHDMDHPGVPNATLVKEETELAAQYNNKSVAEQNSVDLAWEILMGEDYKELRSTICATKSDKKRFRQLIVNAVMATDIADQELKKLRNARWDKAFKLGDAANHVDENPRDEINRKATIVIEHLIQASDIAHTMQHWHIYRKWNERFFEEMYNAYLEGRAETDPTTFWYKGEIGFFDFYIIPLAKKLKDCGVFGVSSDEYLNYAETNRKEWEAKGKEVVEDYIEKYGKKKEEDDALKKFASELEDVSSKSAAKEEAPP